MSTHKRNWMLIWTAVGALAVAVPVAYPAVHFVINLPDRLAVIEQDTKEVKHDVKLLMMHQGIAETYGTNHFAAGKETKQRKGNIYADETATE